MTTTPRRVCWRDRQRTAELLAAILGERGISVTAGRSKNWCNAAASTMQPWASGSGPECWLVK